MGVSESKQVDYEEESNLSEDELNEEVEYIWVICVPMHGRNWQIFGKVVLTLTVVGGFFNGIIPLSEHHGLLVKSKNGNYYFTHFPANNGAFKKDSKERAIKDIIDKCGHYDNRKWWVRAKFKPEEKMTIGEVKNVAKKVKFKEYNIITKNCQEYVRLILYNLRSNLKMIGMDALSAGGGLSWVKGGDLSC